MEENQVITLCFAGDVGPNRKDPHSLFTDVAPVVHRADIAFCQLEPALSKRGVPMPQARLAMRADPAGAGAIKAAGFHVVSFASNHCMDWGPEAFFDTIGVLKDQGLSVIGVGANIEEARKPAIFDCKGTKIAFLAYNTILPMSYWAETDRPGCAPLRAWTYYEQIEHDQPGTPCRVHTFAHEGDRAAMAEDVRKARASADIVIVSAHWGLHFIPSTIADYQRELGHAAVDAGADIVIGHHAHILKGVEVYKGKAIFYSLANFALEGPASFAGGALRSPGQKELRNLYGRPGSKSDSPMSEDSMKTILVTCAVRGKAISEVAFQPVRIDEDYRPVMLAPEDNRFREIVAYIEEITGDQGLEARFVTRANRVVVSGRGE